MNMNLALRLSAFIVGALAFNASAATHADFYCNEIPQARPAYYNVAVKNCGGNAKSESFTGVCTQTAVCIFVTEDLKKSAKEILKKDFSSLTEDEKKTFIKGNTKGADWLPTILTCQGSMTVTLGPICPTPEQCKGDIFYNMQPALITPEKFIELNDRMKRGDTRIFQGDSSAGAVK